MEVGRGPNSGSRGGMGQAPTGGDGRACPVLAWAVRLCIIIFSGDQIPKKEHKHQAGHIFVSQNLSPARLNVLFLLCDIRRNSLILKSLIL